MGNSDGYIYIFDAISEETTKKITNLKA